MQGLELTLETLEGYRNGFGQIALLYRSPQKVDGLRSGELSCSVGADNPATVVRRNARRLKFGDPPLTEFQHVALARRGT